MWRRETVSMAVCGCLILAVYLLLTHIGPLTQPDGPRPLTQLVFQEATAAEQEASSAASNKEGISVERGPFSVAVTVKGTLVSSAAMPVKVAVEAWKPDQGGSPLVIQKVVPHGTYVNRGDPIVWLDTTKISDAIRDLEHNLKLARIGIEIAEKEAALLEQSVPVELSSTERAKREADEDLERFCSEDRAVLERDADEDLKQMRMSLEFVEEELNQLEKMYKADDLVEETERIILKRQQFMVDYYRWLLTVTEKRRRDLLRFELPRRELALREAVDKTAIAATKAKTTLAPAAEKQRLELEKLKQQYSKDEERLAKLRRDRDTLTAITAPAEGLVYYGRFREAKWVDVETAQNQLVPGAALPTFDLPLTIVNPKDLQIVAEIEEKHLEQVQVAGEGRARITAYPDKRITVQVQSVSPQPSAPGKFLAHFSLRSPSDNPSLMPGMSCDVRLLSYSQPMAIAVPKEVVCQDDADPDNCYVYVLGSDGNTQKRLVKVGRRNDSRIEILEGLEEGEKIVPPDQASRRSSAG